MPGIVKPEGKPMEHLHRRARALAVFTIVYNVVEGLVATGFGACLVSRSATFMCIPGVTFRPLHHPTMSQVDLCCIYRSDDASELLRAFLGSMRQAIGQR